MKPLGRASYQSALVVLVPEAEPLVAHYRKLYDPSAAAGMPAHVTINYPFLPGLPVNAHAIDQLGAVLPRLPSFRFALIRAARFPGTLYLAPEPDEPFTRLIRAVWRDFPSSPPYGGTFAKVVPHLTVAQPDTPQQLEGVADEFAAACEGKLPIPCVATRVWLVDNQNARWEKRLSFRLGAFAPV
jgi:2'-5' RNA ligase